MKELEMRANDGGPAFPFTHEWPNSDGSLATETCDGMSLRDYFAAKAMAALITSEKWSQAVLDTAKEADGSFKNLSNWFAKSAYEYADAMLKAREEQ